MEEKKIRKGDFVFAIVLILMSIIIVLEARKMPIPGELMSSPGFVPTILAVILMLMGLGLLVFSIKHGGHLIVLNMFSIRFGAITELVRSEIFVRTSLAFLLVGLYVFLLGKMPFYFLTFIFLVVFMITLRTMKMQLKVLGAYVFLTLVLLGVVSYFFSSFYIIVP